MDYKKIYREWVENSTLPVELITDLKAIENDEEEIKDRFASELEFRTAGMRGIIGAGVGRMNMLTVNRATKGLADYLLSLGEKAAKRGVVIAYDTRRYSFEFALSAAKVLAKNRVKAYLFDDVRPVPMGSFAIRHLNAAAGIIITASHNPKEYNGYKVYGEDGAQMGIEATAEVVSRILKTGYFAVEAEDIDISKKEDIKNKDQKAFGKYLQIIGKSVDEAYYRAILKLTLSCQAVKAESKNIKLVYTPLHGSGYVPVTTVLSRIGIEANIVEEQKYPDYDFSTVTAPNPEEKDALSLGIKLAEKIGADVVLGTDPDCDRMGVALRDGDSYTLLTGNQTGALLLDYILMRRTETGTLPKNAAAVKTIVTTELAAAIARSYSCEIIDVLTGFKFIGEKIKEWENDGSRAFIFGYEESYGYLAGTHARDKDAVVAAMLFSEMACYYKSAGKSVLGRLNELFRKFGYYVEKNISIAYKGSDAMEKMSAVMRALRAKKPSSFAKTRVAFTDDYETGIRTYPASTQSISLPKTDVVYYGLDGGGFLCVRPSGTEPKLKIYVSVLKPSLKEAGEYADGLLNAAKAALEA